MIIASLDSRAAGRGGPSGRAGHGLAPFVTVDL
jgi:hypothetical protein